MRSYGISVTTLEEVFLRVGHGDDTRDNDKVIDQIKRGKSKSQTDFDGAQFSIAETQEDNGAKVFATHMKALFLKRFYIYKRNYKGLIIEVLIPVLLVLIGFAFTKIQFFNNAPDRELDPSLFPLKQRIICNEKVIRSSSWDISPRLLMQSLPSFDTDF